jgi:hypothetical protein
MAAELVFKDEAAAECDRAFAHVGGDTPRRAGGSATRPRRQRWANRSGGGVPDRQRPKVARFNEDHRGCGDSALYCRWRLRPLKRAKTANGARNRSANE